MPEFISNFMDDLVAELTFYGLKVVHADMSRHYGRMITIVVDEGDPDKVTVFEIWPNEGFVEDLAAIAVAARENNGPGLVFEIGDDPRGE